MPVCMCVCLHRTDIIIAIDNASHAIITRWGWIAFFRWLTAVHVNNNNICSAFIPLPNNFLCCSSTEDGEAKFILIFLNSLRAQLNERMNDRILQHISTVKTRGSSSECVRRWSMIINKLGDDCLLRMRVIIPLLVKRELGVF